MEVQSPQFAGAPCGQSGAHTFYRAFRFRKHGRAREIALGEFFFVRISPHDDPCIGELQLLCASKHPLSALRLYFLPEQTPDGRLAHHGQDEVLVASSRVVLRLPDLVGWITEEVEWRHGIVAPGPKPRNDSNNNLASKDDLPLDDGGGPSTSSESEPRVAVLSYLQYCRYRSVLKRLEGGDSGEGQRNALVQALGGFAASRTTHVLFCRDSFEHDDLHHLDLNCEHLAPTLKQKKRKKKVKNTRSISPESITSEEHKALIKANQKSNGLKQPPIKNKQEFLQRLNKFMKKRNTPIHRVPNLGFKQIDLHIFWSFAQKLGGYDKITGKKLWKHVYDELGGNPGSTSAATCTRRHYEKLLLPFERFMAGIVYKPTSRGKKPPKPRVVEKAEPAQKEEPKAKEEPVAGPSTQAEDAYAFPDSDRENSNSFEDVSAADDQVQTNDTAAFSDEDSKTVWSIQKQPDSKDETDKDDGKPIKPLIIQKGQGETFAEKERKWDEIRKKNAAARKWVRQSRSNRGSKSTPSDMPMSPDEKQSPPSPIKTEVPSSPATPTEVKVEAAEIEMAPTQKEAVVLNGKFPDIKPNVATISSFLSPTVAALDPKVKVEKIPVSSKKNRLSLPEIPTVSHEQKSSLTTKCSPTVKSEPRPKSTHSEPIAIIPSPLPSPKDAISLKNHVPHSSRAGMRLDSDYSSLSGRLSVGSLSASSAVSVEGSARDKTVPQRRPSVIQHTEHAATSPSPSLSPRQAGDRSPRDAIPVSKGQLLPSQYSTAGKVAEWLTKGVHEVVACRTPSASAVRASDLHERVMMPSSCKTPGAVGTGKVPASTGKGRTKTPKSKGPGRQRNTEPVPNGSYSLSRSANFYHKVPHQGPPAYSVISNPAGVHAFRPPNKSESFPFYAQPKRQRVSNTPISVPPVAPARPCTSPFVRRQTYCTAPLGDVPRTAGHQHSDCDSVALDLSTKKRPLHVPRPVAPVLMPPAPEEGVCLDLSLKKKPNFALDNGIENITPPLPLSPSPSLPYLPPPLKPLSSLLSLQDLAAERNTYGANGRLPPVASSTVASPATTLPLMHSGSTLFSGNTHTKLPPGLAHYSKELAKSLYTPSTHRQAQFSPYVIPPFFPANWNSVVNASAINSKHQQPSPTPYKVNHVFPKDYPYNVKSQFHPALYKDNGHFASNGKK